MGLPNQPPPRRSWAVPELPEVETIVRQLRPELVGRRIESVRVHWPRSIARPSARSFCADLVGARIEKVWRRAKYFVFSIESGGHVVGHLRMSGRLYVGDGPDPDYLRVSFQLDDGRQLSFVDVRKFGRLALVDDVEAFLPHIGPEPLGPDLTPEWMRRELRARRRQLKPLLLDQSFLAGLGNIYVDETLHQAGLHPLRRSDRVPGARAEELALCIRDVLSKAVKAEGSSFDTFYRTPEGQPGAYQEDFQVYGRDGKPCRSCGTLITKLVVAQRGTHVCHRCQPAPRPRRRP
jgi:formamidopyrimidine-DNA glycosylase